MGSDAVESRVDSFLGKAGLVRPQRIPAITRPSTAFLKRLSDSSKSDARELLISRKISEPDYRSPDSKWRNKWSTRRTARKMNQENWTFSKYEIAKAFDATISANPIAAPGVAQALISDASLPSLNELWHHRCEYKLRKRVLFRFRTPAPQVLPDITWLDTVTAQRNLDYVRLMCNAGLDQASLDRALGVALSKRYMDVAEILLGYNATVSTHWRVIQDALVQQQDIGLARLLLSAPKAMSVDTWQHCIKSETLAPTNILHVCLAHRPEICSAELLIAAIQAQNFEATVVFLAYAGSTRITNFAQEHEAISGLASMVENHELRWKFFDLLSHANLLKDSTALREELMEDVRLREMSLIKILVAAGIRMDVEPFNAFHWTVSILDFEILEIMQTGVLYSPVSPVLKLVPDSTSETDMLRLINILIPHDLDQESLSSQLIYAVDRQHSRLAERLLECGASIDFEMCSAVRMAVEKSDVQMFGILLTGECSPKNLTSVIPAAMSMKARYERSQVMSSLVRKGVLVSALAEPLQALVAEEGEMDVELIRMLVQSKAPVDVEDGASNAIWTAVRKGNLSVLRILCNAGPRKSTVSKAVPMAFSTIEPCGYELAMAMISVLLRQGANGEPVSKTLLSAVASHCPIGMTRLLLEHGADANYEHGACFDIALKSRNAELLENLCAATSPTQTTIASVLDIAIDPQYFDLRFLELLLGSAQESISLDALWNSDKLRSNPNLSAILPCFLRHGLDVDVEDGAVVCFAVESSNVILLRRILDADPSIQSLKAGFAITNGLQKRHIQLAMMEQLLQKAKSAEIGQSDVLARETRRAVVGDYEGLRLLLRHEAMLDTGHGEAIATAAFAGSFRVLDELLQHSPSPELLIRICIVTASSKLISNIRRTRALEYFAGCGAMANHMSLLLCEALRSAPDRPQLAVLALSHGAKVTLRIIELALATAEQDLFGQLIRNTLDTSIARSAFNSARKANLPQSRRVWVYDILLSKDTCFDEINQTLVEELAASDLHNLDTIKVLLRHGADVGHDNAKPFVQALSLQSVDTAKLLSQYISNDNTAELAFGHACTAKLLSEHVRTEVYRCLLQWSIRPALLIKALVASILDPTPSASVVQLLIESCADLEVWDCLVLAACQRREPEFRVLCSKAKSIRSVILMLLGLFPVEKDATDWVLACLDERPLTLGQESHEESLLYRCIDRFPQGVDLIRALLDNGVSALAKRKFRISERWPEEPCTILMWAILSPRKVDQDIILLLLAYAVPKLNSDPTYLSFTTENSGVSAAFGCLLDTRHAVILKYILELDRDGSLAYEIPVPSFMELSIQAKIPFLESSRPPQEGKISLRYAALYLGNLGAFKLLNRGHRVDDGMLHFSALLALPRFVEWLLTESHNPNLKREEYDYMIPLALVCQAQHLPWSKIANDEADFRTRQAQVMKILAPRTNLKWRYRHKTVLHIALENGVETTKAMLEALLTRNAVWDREQFQYTDKEGKEYGPLEYVSEILEGSEEVKTALKECLQEHGGFRPSSKVATPSTASSESSSSS